MPKLKELSQKQADFINWYTSPASPTYDNITQSAIRAGYTEKYARSQAYRTLKKLAQKHIQKRTEKVEQAVDRSQFYNDLLHQAEMNIQEDLNIKSHDPKMLALKQKSTHFTAERIGKDRWSQRKEVENTGKLTLPPNALEKLQSAFESLTIDNQPKPHADYEVFEGKTVAIDEQKENN